VHNISQSKFQLHVKLHNNQKYVDSTKIEKPGLWGFRLHAPGLKQVSYTQSCPS